MPPTAYSIPSIAFAAKPQRAVGIGALVFQVLCVALGRLTSAGDIIRVCRLAVIFGEPDVISQPAMIIVAEIRDKQTVVDVRFLIARSILVLYIVVEIHPGGRVAAFILVPELIDQQ